MGVARTYTFMDITFYFLVVLGEGGLTVANTKKCTPAILTFSIWSFLRVINAFARFDLVTCILKSNSFSMIETLQNLIIEFLRATIKGENYQRYKFRGQWYELEMCFHNS